MIRGYFQAGTGPHIAMPHFSNNMFHGQGPLQFTVRQIAQGFLIFVCNIIVQEQL